MRAAVTMALAPTRASAAAASARRHSSGSGAAIMPARSTPSSVSTLSTVLGKLDADDGVGLQAEPRSRAAIAEIDAVGLAHRSGGAAGRR